MKRTPALVSINDRILENSEYKMGRHYSDNGLIYIIWIEYQSEKDMKIEIK